MTILAFDVDGTLTDPRKPIDQSMLNLMLKLVQTHRVWLVTGSDEPKCREQVGSLFLQAERVYCCAGAELWMNGIKTKYTDWNPPVQLIIDLFSALEASDYPDKTGKHVEIRTGMVNLSIPGRNATQVQREQFTAWDEKTGVRRRIADEINRKYPKAHATLGGKTGIDITEKGRGKHTILVDTDDSVWFWGDECRAGGNDYSLAQELSVSSFSQDRIFHTTGWQDTYHQLRELFDA